MKWLNHLLDLIYPRSCEACESSLLGEENLICTKCLINLPRTNSHIERAKTLEQKFWGKIPVTNTLSFLKFTKKGRVQKLLHELKYRNKPDVGVFLGKIYGSELKQVKFNEKIDLIIGIPLHEDRFKKRGYNQADSIAEGLSETLDIPYDSKIVIRVKNTNTQTKKSRIDRFKNVENIFEVVDKEKIKDLRVAIVDDVLTTGSTLESLGNTLLDSGCKDISIITLATAI